MFSVLFWSIIIAAIIGFSKYIYNGQVNFFARNYYAFPKVLRKRIKRTEPFRDLIWFINLLLFVLIIFQLGAIMAFKFGSYGATSALIKNIFFWFGKESGYDKLPTLFFYTIIAFVASYYLSKYLKEYHKKNDTEGIKAIIELRKLLDNDKTNLEIYRDLHFGVYDFIEIPSNQEEEMKQMELFRYLEVIALAGSMVRKDIIDVEFFYKQFGSRVTDVAKCITLKDYLDSNRESWRDLLWIIRELKKLEKANSESSHFHSDHTTNTPPPLHESELFSKGKDLMKKGGKYLFDDKE